MHISIILVVLFVVTAVKTLYSFNICEVSPQNESLQVDADVPCLYNIPFSCKPANTKKWVRKRLLSSASVLCWRMGSLLTHHSSVNQLSLPDLPKLLSAWQGLKLKNIITLRKIWQKKPESKKIQMQIMLKILSEIPQCLIASLGNSLPLFFLLTYLS